MLIPALIAAGLAGAGYAISRRPGAFHLERSITVAAPPEAPFALVNDFRNWAQWSPYERLDPAMKKSFSGPATGTGAGYAWNGSGKAGEGSMVITRSEAPSLISIKLEFVRPFRAVNQATFSFTPGPGGTKVTWSMDGQNNYVAKLMHLVIDMDKLVGKDFEAGLASLKALAEGTAAA